MIKLRREGFQGKNWMVSLKRTIPREESRENAKIDHFRYRCRDGY